MNTGGTLWFTGLSGSGKSTLSQLVATRLREMGAKVEVLDGDIIRTLLCQGLGFTREDREENIRRIGFVCELLARNGVIAIAAAISPYRAGRDELRHRIPKFIEVYMNCPVEVLIQRDVKGLYKKALAGEIEKFTGISDPYEPPIAPEVTIDSSADSLEASVAIILRRLEEFDIISGTGAGVSAVPATIHSI
ncbi:MAG: adenylyl-sulfate kinase [Terracidiphilus sp.]